MYSTLNDGENVVGLCESVCAPLTLTTSISCNKWCGSRSTLSLHLFQLKIIYDYKIFSRKYYDCKENISNCLVVFLKTHKNTFQVFWLVWKKIITQNLNSQGVAKEGLQSLEWWLWWSWVGGS